MTEYEVFLPKDQLICLYQTEDADEEKDTAIDLPYPVDGVIIGDLYNGPIGGLFTRFLRADLDKEAGLQELEKEWKYPTWLKSSGDLHNRDKIESLLLMLRREQSHMKRVINLCLEMTGEDGELDTGGRLFGYNPSYGYDGLSAIERFHLHYLDTKTDHLIEDRLVQIKLNFASAWKKGIKKELKQIKKIEEIKSNLMKTLSELKKASDSKIIQKQVQRLEAELKHETAKGYESLWEYKSYDILALCWLELMKCIEYDKKAKKCHTCDKYFIISGRTDTQNCPYCPKHKRRTKTPLEKERDKMYMRYYRPDHPSSITIEEYNSWLKANGFPEHSPMKKGKGRS